MNARFDRAKVEAQAEKLIKKERYEEAVAAYQKLLSGGEQDIPIRNIIGDLYVKAGRKARAVEEFKKIADHFQKKGIYTKTIAIYKRITRLLPGDTESQRKLADLYRERGFLQEARVEYRKWAERMVERGKTNQAIEANEILLKLDSRDVETRLKLSELYLAEGLHDQALEKLNEAAEFRIQHNEFKEAEEILKKARSLKEGHARTLENLIDLYKRQNRRKEALKLVQGILKKDKKNLKALSLLGGLCLEAQELDKAEEIFTRILSTWPQETGARIKLGRVYIRKKRMDDAFALLEPLVDTLLKKHRADKAVGILGLILTVECRHIPSLEKLAAVFRESGQKRHLEIVCRRLAQAYREKGMPEKARDIQAEVSGHPPPAGEVRVGTEVPGEMRGPQLQPPEGPRRATEKTVPEEREKVPAEEEAGGPAADTVERRIAQADLYIEQGLLRNAKRTLEDLRSEYPDDARVARKIKELGALTTQVKREEVLERVEKREKKEAESLPQGEKLTAAEIFTDTDIIPLVTLPTGEKKYYDLSRQISEELEAVRNIFYQQTRGDTTIVEKELSAIVAEFKIHVDRKIGTADLETRFNLGLAYLEQGLVEEAVQEFKLAAEEEMLKLECYTNLAECYKRKSDLDSAAKWYQKALRLVKKGSLQEYALKYELGLLYEAQEKKDEALALYREVMDWDSGFGDVKNRIKALRK